MARGKLDFEDTNFDFDEDFKDFETPQVRSPKTAREAIATAAPSVLTGMKDAATDPTTIRDIVSKAMPRSFSYMLDETDKYAGSYDQLQRQLGKEVRPAVTAMGKLAKRINGIIPHPFQGKLDHALDRIIKERDETAAIDADEASIESGLRDGMGDEGTLTENGRAEAAITKIDERNYRVGMYNALSDMRSMTRQYTQYQFTQNRTYQRKVLEVQLRQLMTQRRLLETQAKGNVEISNLLRDVVKNTGLPEYAKERANEAFRRTSREMMFGAVQRPIADWSRNYFRNVTRNMGGLLTEKARNFREGATNADEAVAMLDEQMKMAKEMGVSPWEIFGEMGGDSLFKMLGGVTADKVGKILPMKGKLDNFFSYVTTNLRNAPNMLNEVGRKRRGGHRFLDQLLGTLAVGHDKDDANVVRGSALKGLDGMSLEVRNNRALEEIIPGYLSRMLHTMEMIRTGDASIPRTVFNREKGTFTTLKQSAADLEKAIVSGGAMRNQADDVQSLMTEMGIATSDGALRAVMSRHLLKQTEGTSPFRIEDYLNEDVNGLTPRQKKRLATILTSRYGLQKDDKGKYKAGLKAKNSRIMEAQNRYRYLQQGNISLYNKVHGAVGSGNMDELMELGAIRYDEDEKGWLVDPNYKQGRLDQAVAKEILQRKVKPNQDRAGHRSAADSLNPKREPTSTVSASPLPGKADIIGGSAAKMLRATIRSQTEELVANLQDIIQHSAEQTDILANIEQELMQGINVNGFGVSITGGKLGRGLRRLGRGAGWAGKKLWDFTGLPFRGAAWMGKKITSPIWTKGKNWLAGKDISGKVNKLKTDVYVWGEQGFRKAIDAVGFEEGRYTNMVDGSPIRTIRDIKGAVYDTVQQKQILSQEEYEKGLLNSVGKKIFGGVGGMVRTLVGKAWGVATAPARWTFNAAKSMFNGATSMLMAPPDIYVPGETSPRILGTVMYKGTVYYSGNTGGPLKYLGDIDGEIVTFDKLTGERKVIISQDEVMAGLVNQYGKPLTPFLRKVRNLLEGAKNLAGKAWKAPKAVWDWAKRQFKAAGAAVSKGLGTLLRTNDNKLTQVYWLQRIYKLMYLKYTGKTIGTDKDLQDAMGSISGKVSAATTKLGETIDKGTKRLKSKAKELKEKAEHTTSYQRARQVTDELAQRTGSWWNQMRETKGKAIKETISRKIEEHKSQGKGWMGMLLSGISTIVLGGLGTLATKFMSGFGWLKTFLSTRLPLMMLRSATVASGASSAEDAAGSMMGGKWGRKFRKGWRKFTTTKVGKVVAGAGRLAGRAASIVLPGAAVSAATGGTAAAAAGAAAGAASTAAAGAATAAGGILSAVGSGLVAVGSFLASPWVLAAVAAGAVLYGGYKLYKYYQRKSDFELSQKLRLVQYGLQLDRQHDACAKVLALEGQLADAVNWRDGSVAFDTRKIDMNGIADLFGVTRGAGRQFTAMQTWLTRRFLPIYGAWLQAAKSNGQVGTLDNLDTRVASAVMRSIISASYLADLPDSSSPYFVSESPIPGYWCTQGKQRIDATIQEAYHQLEAGVKDASGRAVTARTLGAAEGFDTPSNTLIKGKSLLQPTQKGQDERLDNYYGAAERLTKGQITGNIVSDAVIAKFNEIDDLTALRMKVYGLTKLQKVYVDTLQRFERELYANATFDAKGQVVLAYSGGIDIFRQYCGMFGLDRGDKDAAQIFTYWVEKRFIPAYSAFLVSTKQIDPYGNPFDAYSRYKGAELLQVATAISSATTAANDGRKYSVWNIDAVPFAGEHANLNSSSADVNMEAFRRAAKNDTYADSKTSGKTKLSTAGATLLDQKVGDLASDLAGATGDKKSYTFQNKANNSYTSMNNMSTSWQSAGFGTDQVSGVKLNGSAKQRGEALMKAAIAAGISGDELALFMGTCAEESGDFSAYVERSPDVARYARNQGLGNGGSIENARKYIGRGPMQLTGLANYQNMAKWLGVDVVAHPELLEDTDIGANSAVAYWLNYVRPLVKRKGRQMDPLTVSAATNGWYEDPNGPGGIREPIGYAVRLKKMQQWAAIINGRAPDPTTGGMGEQNTAAAATPNGNGQPPDATGTATPTPTGDGRTGGQSMAPAAPGAASTTPANLITPAGTQTKGGQEVAPAAPSDVLTRASTPSATPQSSVRAPTQVRAQSTAQQQELNAQTARGRTLNQIADEQLSVLKEIRELMKVSGTGGQTPAKPAGQVNRSPSAPPEDGAPVSAQASPTESAVRQRQSAPEATSGGRALPYNLSH